VEGSYWGAFLYALVAVVKPVVEGKWRAARFLGRLTYVPKMS
jgi:hypothetical protein